MLEQLDAKYDVDVKSMQLEDLNQFDIYSRTGK